MREDYPLSLLCETLGFNRSSHYYQPHSPTPDEQTLIEAIEAVVEEWPTYGYRRVTFELRRKGWTINHKRVLRVMHQRKLIGLRPSRKVRTTNSQHPFQRYPNLVLALEITRPEQVWVADITYVRLHSGFVYLAILMDVYTRIIRGWHLSRSIDADLTATALRKALKHGTPEIHHSDQGVQYAANEYLKALPEGVKLSMAEVGEAWQNGFAERVIRTIKEEWIDLCDYQNFADAFSRIGQFVEDVYNHKRIHSSLGYLTPAEFEQQYKSGLTEEGEVVCSQLSGETEAGSAGEQPAEG